MLFACEDLSRMLICIRQIYAYSRSTLFNSCTYRFIVKNDKIIQHIWMKDKYVNSYTIYKQDFEYK